MRGSVEDIKFHVGGVSHRFRTDFTQIYCTGFAQILHRFTAQISHRFFPADFEDARSV